MRTGEFAELLQSLICARISVDRDKIVADRSGLKAIRRSKQNELIVDLADGTRVYLTITLGEGQWPC